MRVGKRTWKFKNHPSIVSTGTVGGPFEAQGSLADDFDVLHEDLWLREDSFEKAQRKMMEEACDLALKKENITKEQVDFFIGGDLINQITPSSFAAKTLDVPYFGIFSACGTSMESLTLAALMVNAKVANYILSGTSSHNAATERQYRYPTEYGGQKPPTAQWTVTGAGCALVAQTGHGPFITTATPGKVIDLGMTDPFNMGGAMAPAAVDTIIAHLNDRKVDPSYYDLIVTGDLGKIGRKVSLDLLKEKGVEIADEKYVDCGVMIYKDDQPVLAGASGSACSAVVTYGYLFNLMKQRQINRMLIVATGALHSPLTIQQNETMPCIAHAVSIETDLGSDDG